jgi:hypothetical protein
MASSIARSLLKLTKPKPRECPDSLSTITCSRDVMRCVWEIKSVARKRNFQQKKEGENAMVKTYLGFQYTAEWTECLL